MKAPICSPDKIDPFNKNNPKTNRILNCIAISAISSFLKFPFNFSLYHKLQKKNVCIQNFAFLFFFFEQYEV